MEIYVFSFSDPSVSIYIYYPIYVRLYYRIIRHIYQVDVIALKYYTSSCYDSSPFRSLVRRMFDAPRVDRRTFVMGIWPTKRQQHSQKQNRRRAYALFGLGRID